MKRRNLLYKRSEYKGKEITVVNGYCPCLPCYHVYDCGDRNSCGRWIERFVCLTNHHHGCPDNDKKPAHIIKKDNPLSRKPDTARKCLRCGDVFLLKDNNFEVEI